MRRLRRARHLSVAAGLAVAVAGVACGPGTTDTEADQPVVVNPNEEVGETLLPETPSEAEGTDG